ncbi:hypothetical protein FVEG_17455 [Fusarium verticillioides 7600]|uniref:Uncharacterized protein n=1 Tax=Gibberella moniliformis (strain M3125 / FGSC 7600) TaxID=334819 RepID=W7MV74_GIBM7|nr:hypothetical protein FVEG_17455 [Fusarium verticillioides 7600]EWG55081.1 hypothetical protein FVEG_17455 [Fusarium verticillioides 7600]
MQVGLPSVESPSESPKALYLILKEASADLRLVKVWPYKLEDLTAKEGQLNAVVVVFDPPTWSDFSSHSAKPIAIALVSVCRSLLDRGDHFKVFCQMRLAVAGSLQASSDNRHRDGPAVMLLAAAIRRKGGLDDLLGVCDAAFSAQALADLEVEVPWVIEAGLQEEDLDELKSKDTAAIPLEVNTIHFSTSDNWSSLTACFNLVATAYYIIEQDLAFHLAEFITSTIFAKIDAKFPRFRSMFESELTNHNTRNPADGRPRSRKDLVDRVRPPLCHWVGFFFGLKVDRVDVYGPSAYLGLADIHEEDFMDPYGKLPGDSHDRWQQQSGDVRDALSYCLRLIAEEAPMEFEDQVHKTLPHWTGKYHPKEFLGLKFNLWDIPSREDVAHALDLLNIHDFVWKLPELWTYPDEFYQELGDIPYKPRPENAERCQYGAEYDNPMRMIDHFDYRYRDKIRFSATATAIRFFNTLPAEQRTQIRRITLHEDAPSVNMSLHAPGLVPLYKENPRLQVERRLGGTGEGMDDSGQA